MSEIKVNSIKGVGATAAAITVNNSNGTCTANITNNLSNRNLVINGNMVCSQRASSFASITDAYCLDRYKFRNNNGVTGTFTVSQSTETPDEFGNSLKVAVGTQDTALAAGESFHISTRLEGQNLQSLAKGTSSAKKSVLSFYVKTNKNGTYAVMLYDNDNNRQFTATYTVSNANWNRYTIDVPADTTGAFGNDNLDSLHIYWYLGAGANFTGGSLASSWQTYAAASEAVGQVNFAESNSNEFYITGIQYEVNESGVATDFEHRSFGQELALCQRYFHIIKTGSGEEFYLGQLQVYGSGACHGKYFHFPVTMRTKPTTTLSGNITPTNSSGSFTTNFSSATFDRNSPEFVGSNNTSGSSGLSAGNTAAVGLRENSSISSSAEL